jgi:hypothetical protein
MIFMLVVMFTFSHACTHFAGFCANVLLRFFLQSKAGPASLRLRQYVSKRTSYTDIISSLGHWHANFLVYEHVSSLVSYFFSGMTNTYYAHMHSLFSEDIHTCIHTYIQTYVRMYVPTSIHPYIHTCSASHPYIQTYVHTHASTYIHQYRYIFERADVAFLHAHVHTHADTHIHTVLSARRWPFWMPPCQARHVS